MRKGLRRVLVTGMSGTGKSAALACLGQHGFHVVDTDDPGWSEWSAAEDGYLWHEDRISELLAAAENRSLFVSGTVSNQRDRRGGLSANPVRFSDTPRMSAPAFTVDTTELPNGLQVVEIATPRVATSLGFDFPAGSLHEQPGETGLAHLLEHVVFRGTRDYLTSHALNRSIEVIGAELEGATGPDGVTVYTTVRGDRAQTALDLITQVTTHPLMREADLEHERQVVLQEISDNLDDPESRADALINRAVFGEHRLATDVTGDPEDVEHLDHAALTAFHHRQWASRGGLVVLAGDLQHLDRERVHAQLGEVGTGGEPRAKTPVAFRTGQVLSESTDSDITHLRVNYAVAETPFTSIRNRATTSVLGQMLGGTMTSRLLNELREVRPLCYWVDASIWGYETATFLSIGCSVAPGDAAEALERITAIVTSLREDGPQAGEVEHFRSHITGAVGLGIDGSSNVMWNALRSVREYGDPNVDPRAVLTALEAVTEADVRDVCTRISADPCVATLGPSR